MANIAVHLMLARSLHEKPKCRSTGVTTDAFQRAAPWWAAALT